MSFVKLVFDLTRLGVAMPTSRGSDLDDANNNGRKRQDRSNGTEDNGYRERVQSVGRGGRAGSTGCLGRASIRADVRAKHAREVN